MLDFTEVQMVRAWVVTAIARVRSDRNERGEVAQTVIIVAILAAAAIAIATIIATKFRDKANSIPTE
jgi:ABC-type enterochelin transport system permease subunit